MRESQPEQEFIMLYPVMPPSNKYNPPSSPKSSPCHEMSSKSYSSYYTCPTTQTPIRQSHALPPSNKLPSPRRIRLVHRRDLSRNRRPLQFSSDWLPSSLLADLIPFQQLVRESEMWLDNHVQPPRPYVAVRPWERKAM